MGVLGNNFNLIKNEGQNVKASDPLIDYIRQHAGPYSANGSWHDKAAGAARDYMSSLSSEDLVKRYSNYDPAALQQQAQQVLGRSDIDLSGDQTNALAYKSYQDTFKRAPTGSELAQISPYFQGPNGSIAGRQAIANLQQQYKLNPSIDPGSKQNTTKPEDFNKQIADTFQSTVGRAPTANELAYFQKEFSTGALDAYGLESSIKQSSEYTNAQDKTFRQGLNQELTNYDTYAFQKMGAPQLMSQYAQNGMPAGTSPSLDYALTDLMGKISQNRSNYLAQLSASQYGGNKDLANQNYQGNLGQLMNNWSGNLNRSNTMSDYLNQRGYNGMDYQTQQNDFMKYLNSQKQPVDNTLNYLNAGLNAINTGANVYAAGQKPGGTL